MISCLFPDCEWRANHIIAAEVEARKRATIDHINADHDDAHVLIACAHDWVFIEEFTATTRSGDTGQPLEFKQKRERCVRCGQFQVSDADPAEGDDEQPDA